MNQQKSQIFESIELHSLLRDVIRNFWAVILAGAIAFLGIYIAEHSVYAPTYKSSATVVVRAKSATSGAYTNLAASTEMANIYTKVFTQPAMKKLAAENIGLESFDGTIETSVYNSTNLMNISVISSEPETAYKLLKSVLEIYPDVSEAVFSNGVIDIIVAPEMPVSPSNTISNSRRIELSILAALAQFVLIIVFSFLRDTVKNEKIFKNKIDGKMLGTIAHEKRPLTFWQKLRGKKRAMLIDTAFASLKFSENYQQIATKMEYMRKNNDSKVFTVTSVAENEGKSTVTANLAIALANRGYNVVLLDLDLHKPSMYKIFKHRQSVEMELSDVLSGKIPPKEYEFFRYKKTSLYLGFNRKPCSDTSKWLSSENVKECIKTIREKADFVIIDTPPVSVSADAMSIIKSSDKAILVVRTDVVDVPDINDTIMSIRNVGGSFAGCILNDVYKPFTLFGHFGTDERGYNTYRNNSYKRYKGYAKKVLSERLLDTEMLTSVKDRQD